MEINNEFLSKILSGDSSSKVIILDWHIENNVEPGSNHLSVLSRLRVEYQRKGKTFKKSFILKIPSAHPLYKIGIKYKIYEKEYPIYTEILEEMYKLDGEHIGPKLYYTDDKHSMIMKDLAQSGYKMADRIQQLDFDHCYLVLKKLAKFHALSVKLNQDSKIKPAVKQLPWVEMPKDECYDKILKHTCELLAKSIDPKFNLYEKISQLKEDLYDKMRQEIISSDRFTFKVLNHGDFWLGNTLFKYNKYGDPVKVKLIDFQNTSWTSPVLDILGFTINSMQFDVFDRSFDVLMRAYTETLNKTLNFFQCGSYSLEELYCDLDKSPTIIIANLCSRLPVLLSKTEDSIDFQNFRTDDIPHSVYYRKLFKNEKYLEVLNQWISYYVKKDFFDVL